MVVVSCYECGSEFEAGKKNARWCPACQIALRQKHNADSNRKRKAAREQLRASLVCQRCGITFQAKRSDTKYCSSCGQNVQKEQIAEWAKSHAADQMMRQRKRRGSNNTSSEPRGKYPHTCVACGTEFLATRSDAKYCEDCIASYGQIKDQYRHETQRSQARLRHIRIRYGVTENEYNRMLAEQSNCCKLCCVPFIKQPHVEHNHATLQVRGLVCQSCNIGLRYLDNEEWMRKAAAYLQECPSPKDAKCISNDNQIPAL